MLPGPHEGGSPTDHVVAVKSAEQQGQLMQHRTRDLLMRQRTQVINVLRAHLAELGIVAAQGREGLKDLLAIIADEKDERSPVDARASLIVLIVQHRASEESKRVRSFPGSALWARAPSPRRSRIRAPSGRGVILSGTVACQEMPRLEAHSFGVMHVDCSDRIIAFVEKPTDPPGVPENPQMALASMGIYVFETAFLADQLRRDADDRNSSHDFGNDVIPYVVKHGKAVAHRFASSCVRSSQEAQPYWRDVGTIDAYWQANIDLTVALPHLDLFDHNWPIWTYAEIVPPAKFVHDEPHRRGSAVSSLISGGCIISGAFLRQSLLCTGAHVHSYAHIEHAVILPYVDVGRGARWRNVVIDRGVRIPEGLVVGEDPEFDARRFRRTENGICLITQRMIDALTTGTFVRSELEHEAAPHDL